MTSSSQLQSKANFGPIDFRIFYSQSWCEQHKELLAASGPSPYLNPTTFQTLVDHFHAINSYSWSFGGYLERREILWKGSYLDALGAVVHAGIDVNLPQGTPLNANQAFRVIRIDDDKYYEGGWGPRLILEPLDPQHLSHVVIYAHLQNVCVQVGEVVSLGQKMAEIGGPPHNGNWWPHLHIQSVLKTWFNQILQADQLIKMDGYFPFTEFPTWIERYPDPICFMPLSWQLREEKITTTRLLSTRARLD